MGGKRDPNDVSALRIRVAGRTLPHAALHLPLLEVAQMGNTIARSIVGMMEKNKKAEALSGIKQSFMDKIGTGRRNRLRRAFPRLLRLPGNPLWQTQLSTPRKWKARQAQENFSVMSLEAWSRRYCPTLRRTPTTALSVIRNQLPIALR